MTIKSRRLAREITFSRPGATYLYCDMGTPKNCGTLGTQICSGGWTLGATLTYRGDDPEQFAAICRAWWRAYLRNHPTY